MSAVVDLESAQSSLRQLAAALVDLQRKCALLRDARERSHARLDAVAAAIDYRIDECLRVGELLAATMPSEPWRNALAELERQLRGLGVLRSQVLALYLAPQCARCDS
jgi:hypothetical protein